MNGQEIVKARSESQLRPTKKSCRNRMSSRDLGVHLGPKWSLSPYQNQVALRQRLDASWALWPVMMAWIKPTAIMQLPWQVDSPTGTCCIFGFVCMCAFNHERRGSFGIDSPETSYEPFHSESLTYHLILRPQVGMHGSTWEVKMHIEIYWMHLSICFNTPSCLKCRSERSKIIKEYSSPSTPEHRA